MKYGDGCQTDCGHCKDMVQCNHVDGACPNGCEPGYTQDNCTNRTTMFHYYLFIVGQTKQSEIFLCISVLLLFIEKYWYASIKQENET